MSRAFDRGPGTVNGPVVRPMTPADLSEVLGIECSAYQFPWSERVFQDCLRAGCTCQVAADGGRVRGYGILSVAANEAHLLNLCVDPAEHRRGWGGWLLRRLFDVARERSADRMFLEVRPSNQPAVRLYEAHGFVHVGTRRGYYPGLAGRREDARVYTLSLRRGDGNGVARP